MSPDLLLASTVVCAAERDISLAAVYEWMMHVHQGGYMIYPEFLKGAK